MMRGGGDLSDGAIFRSMQIQELCLHEEHVFSVRIGQPVTRAN